MAPADSCKRRVRSRWVELDVSRLSCLADLCDRDYAAHRPRALVWKTSSLNLEPPNGPEVQPHRVVTCSWMGEACTRRARARMRHGVERMFPASSRSRRHIGARRDAGPCEFSPWARRQRPQTLTYHLSSLVSFSWACNRAPLCGAHAQQNEMRQHQGQAWDGIAWKPAATKPHSHPASTQVKSVKRGDAQMLSCPSDKARRHAPPWTHSARQSRSSHAGPPCRGRPQPCRGCNKGAHGGRSLEEHPLESRPLPRCAGAITRGP